MCFLASKIETHFSKKLYRLKGAWNDRLHTIPRNPEVLFDPNHEKVTVLRKKVKV